MPFCDPHIHMYSRTTDDYERMKAAGITAVIEPAFWLGSLRRHWATHIDYLEHVISYEPTRAAKFGVKHHCTIAMNPKEANDTGVAFEVIERMKELLHRDTVVGIGEIGLDRITPNEEEVMRRQLALAEAEKMPVIIHTPHVDKAKGTRRIIDIVREMKCTLSRIVIDHNNEETIASVKELGCWAGHTIYPITKLSPERMIEILRKYGTDRMLFNSSADWGQSDPLIVPKTADLMFRSGFTESDVKKVTWENPIAFFSQSPRFKAPA